MHVNTTYTNEMLPQQKRCSVENSRSKQQNTWLKNLFAQHDEKNTGNNNKNNSIIDEDDLDHKLVLDSLNKFIIYLLDSSIFTNSCKSINEFGTYYYVDDSSKENFCVSKDVLSANKRNSIDKNILNIRKNDSTSFYNHNLEIKSNHRKGTSDSDLKFQDKLGLVKTRRHSLASPYIILLILILISNQNAKLCNGFTNPLRHDNTGLTGNHFVSFNK